MAIAVIRRADAVLGTDHSEFAARAIRGFQGDLLDPIGLPPYGGADSDTGKASGGARGCGNSYMCTWSPELWPDAARQWYDLYEEHFWQKRWGGTGFREFPKGMLDAEWYWDVDSGPVIFGHGIAASAFGLGAARRNGRFDHAYPLASEVIATSWPLPDGRLLGARILSNMTAAPYLGEAMLLFNLTFPPVEWAVPRYGGSIPPLVYCCLFMYLLIAGLCLLTAVRRLRKWKSAGGRRFSHERAQFLLWCTLVVTGAVSGIACGWYIGILILLLAQLLPRERRI